MEVEKPGVGIGLAVQDRSMNRTIYSVTSVSGSPFLRSVAEAVGTWEAYSSDTGLLLPCGAASLVGGLKETGQRGAVTGLL